LANERAIVKVAVQSATANREFFLYPLSDAKELHLLWC